MIERLKRLDVSLSPDMSRQWVFARRFPKAEAAFNLPNLRVWSRVIITRQCTASNLCFIGSGIDEDVVESVYSIMNLVKRAPVVLSFFLHGFGSRPFLFFLVGNMNQFSKTDSNIFKCSSRFWKEIHDVKDHLFISYLSPHGLTWEKSFYQRGDASYMQVLGATQRMLWRASRFQAYSNQCN